MICDVTISSHLYILALKTSGGVKEPPGVHKGVHVKGE